MAETIVVTTSAATPDTPPSPASPATPSDVLIETVHNDALSLGYIAARVEELAGRVSTLETNVTILSSNDAAQKEATDEIVTAVEEIADEVESLEPGDQIESVPEPEIEPDVAPGKTHWLHRDANEWVGRH